jgi:AbiJ-like protein
MVTRMDPVAGQRVLALKETIAAKFDEANWLELALLTGSIDLVRNHSRLIRSMAWGDQDYPGHVFSVLLDIVERDPENLGRLENYVVGKFEGGGIDISPPQNVAVNRIYFRPEAFSVPTDPVEPDLVAVMMPFSPELRPVYEAVSRAAAALGLRCMRADDIWQDAVVIQDIFSLIYRSPIVVCDYTGRNPNVLYETGIAHTLGKVVIPITQSRSDVPFDLQHHRYIHYLNNSEGLNQLRGEVESRLAFLVQRKEFRM